MPPNELFPDPNEEKLLKVYLAAEMLPQLLAHRFELGMGGKPDDEFVDYALKLAQKLIEKGKGD